jgi:tripartite-type tricarboxylate transporter receptor subunit TctC
MSVLPLPAPANSNADDMRPPMLKRRDLLALGLAGVSARALPALGQPRFPERPIRLVIPFPPGGVYDAVGRPWAERMKATLGTIVVENQGGAGGSLGAATVARAQPDGYTMLLGGIGPLIINPVAQSRTPYDPIRDFDPISILVVTAFSIAVHPTLPVRTLQELIDYAHNNPGKLSYGSAGVGSGNHLTGELLKSLTGVDIIHVPYRGAGLAITDLISGQIPMIMANVTGQVIELHHTGKLRLLAVSSASRLRAAPEIPSAGEAGLPGLISRNFISVLAPARTPPPIIAQIAQATRVAMSDQDLQKNYLASGLEPSPDATPEQARHFLEEEIARWTPIIKSIGLKLD